MTSLVIGLVGKRRYGRTTVANNLKANFERVGISCTIFDSHAYDNPFQSGEVLRHERIHGPSVVIYTWLGLPTPEVAEQTDVVFKLNKGWLHNVLQDKTGDGIERMIDFLGECELTKVFLVPLVGLKAPTVLNQNQVIQSKL